MTNNPIGYGLHDMMQTVVLTKYACNFH